MAVDPADARYLILVRHGTREGCWDRPERDHALRGWDAVPPTPFSQFQKEGRHATYALAGRLADQLETDAITVDAIIHGTHRVTLQTAQIYERVLATRCGYRGGCEPDKTLDPDGKVPCTPLECFRKRIAAWRKDGGTVRRACLVIGHQPDLTEIARLFANVPTGVLPVGNAESACIRIARPRRGGRLLLAAWRERRAGRLRWLLTNRPDTLLVELREKIVSKYDVAKFFLGALVLNGGLLLNQNLWSVDSDAALALVALGYLILLMSLGFAIGTLFAYDRLLMPSAFWGAVRDGEPPRWSVARPPSQDQIVLYFAMVHIWTWLFQPAALCAIAALVLFLCALAQAALAGSLGSALNAYTLTAFIGLATMAVAAVVYHVNQPNLGTQD